MKDVSTTRLRILLGGKRSDLKSALPGWTACEGGGAPRRYQLGRRGESWLGECCGEEEKEELGVGWELV